MILGLLVMLGAEGGVPLPHAFGEWLGLASGICWALASIGLRARPVLPPPQSAFLFALGALVCGTVFAIVLNGLPEVSDLSNPGNLFLWVGLTGGLWWAVFIIGLMWAAPKLDPPRVGILLMSEVLVAAASAAWLIGEHLTSAQLAGGALVLLAGLLELVPARRKA